MNVIRWIALLSFLTALPFLARTEDGGHLDPNGYTACIDPNG